MSFHSPKMNATRTTANSVTRPFEVVRRTINAKSPKATVHSFSGMGGIYAIRDGLGTLFFDVLNAQKR
jgi:hypothetical protein